MLHLFILFYALKFIIFSQNFDLKDKTFLFLCRYSYPQQSPFMYKSVTMGTCLQKVARSSWSILHMYRLGRHLSEENAEAEASTHQ